MGLRKLAAGEDGNEVDHLSFWTKMTYILQVITAAHVQTQTHSKNVDILAQARNVCPKHPHNCYNVHCFIFLALVFTFSPYRASKSSTANLGCPARCKEATKVEKLLSSWGWRWSAAWGDETPSPTGTSPTKSGELRSPNCSSLLAMSGWWVN